MQNVLITTAEGPQALGLTLLREALNRAWPTAHVTTLVPRNPQPYHSFATEAGFLKAPTEQTDQTTTIIDATPCDVLRRAFLAHEEWTPHPWDVVLIGVSPETITGTDVFAHANTAIAMLAASTFLAYAVVFNQDPGDADPKDRTTADPATKIIPHYLKTTPIERGRAWNVNIPRATAKHRGYKETNTAHYSARNPPPTTLVPRARDENSDVTALADGFTAITALSLRVNPAIKY
jgi:broad specificity polyphosphatase/5'/3'-nucleotidase SurE